MCDVSWGTLQPSALGRQPGFLGIFFAWRQVAVRDGCLAAGLAAGLAAKPGHLAVAIGTGGPPPGGSAHIFFARRFGCGMLGGSAWNFCFGLFELNKHPKNL
jgi:hypothetical protein